MNTTQQPWYTFPRIDNFGTIDPAGPFWKPDSNIQLPGDYPITALLSGTVTQVAYTNFGQGVVTLKLDTPLNGLATHTFYEHMSGFAPGLNVGQHVSQGQLIGYNNPSGQVPLGFGLYSGDIYGSGSAWNTLQSDLCPGCPNMLNPVSLLDTLKNGGNVAATGTLNTPWSLVAQVSNLLTSLKEFFAWLSNPVRIVKMLVGVALLLLAFYMLVVPDASKQVVQFVKKNPEVLAA